MSSGSINSIRNSALPKIQSARRSPGKQIFKEDEDADFTGKKNKNWKGLTSMCFYLQETFVRVFFCLEPCCLLFWKIMIWFFLATQLKWHMIKRVNQELIPFNKPIIYWRMIKRANQELIPFNEPIIYFYLIEVKFLSKQHLKNNNGLGQVGRFWQYWFFLSFTY